MAEDSGQSVLSSLEAHILPLVPGLSEPIEKRDAYAGCRLWPRSHHYSVAEMFPNSSFRGLDLSNEAVQYAQRVVEQKGLKNISFTAGDLSDFDKTAEPERFDWVTTFDAVHDQAKPLQVLKGIHRTLKSNGVYLMQDIKGSSHVYKNTAHPIGTLLYTISCMHCMTVSLGPGG